MPSPAPRQSGGSWGAARDVLRRSVSEALSLFPGVSVRPRIDEGLAARVLLDQAADADMLVLGRNSNGPDPYRAAGPVIRVGAHKTSMLQDLERRRPMEIDPLVTVVQEMGRLTEGATQALDMVLALGHTARKNRWAV